MLVTGARRLQATLVSTKCRRQEVRLSEHPLRPAVVLRVIQQRFVEQFLQACDGSALSPQLVVEARHLGEEPGP